MGESSTPVTVTVCASLQSDGVKVSLAGITVPSPVSELVTSSTTFPDGAQSSITVNVAVSPASVVRSRFIADVAGTSASPGTGGTVTAPW